MPRQITVDALFLAQLVEAVKRVTPRGAQDGDHLHALVETGERLLGHRDGRAA